MSWLSGCLLVMLYIIIYMTVEKGTEKSRYVPQKAAEAEHILTCETRWDGKVLGKLNLNFQLLKVGHL